MKHSYLVNEEIILHDFLVSKHFSRKLLKRIKLTDGYIHVNGSNKRLDTLLNIGDCVEVKLPTEQIGRGMSPEKMDLDIVYEDDYVLVINKPAGTTIIPTRSYQSGTLANGIMDYYKNKGLPFTVHVVTRLDRQTSGLVLIAKTQFIHHLFSKDLKQVVERKYIGYVKGQMDGEGLIDLPIYQHEKEMKRTIDPKGQQALTKYRVLTSRKDYSIVECQLLTGRTHQIRVHLSALGHPILGDEIYGDKKNYERHFLHSYYIAFQHPITEQLLSFETSDPFKMKVINEPFDV